MTIKRTLTIQPIVSRSKRRLISQYKHHLHLIQAFSAQLSPVHKLKLIKIGLYYYLHMNPMKPQNIHSTVQLREISRENITFPPQPQLSKQCRICLSNIQERDNKFISPCECQGSMRYVHENCIKEWLEVKVVRDIEDEDNEGGVECQLCKRRIRVELQVSKKCRPCQDIGDIIADRFILFMVCILGISFSLGLILYSAVQLGNQIKNGYGNASTFEKVVVICSIILNLLLFIFFSANLTSFFMKNQAEIKLIQG